MCSYRVTAYAIRFLFVLAWISAAALPQSGFVTYSKGDAENRVLHRRLIVGGQLQTEQVICNKGSAGGDIQGVISFDGKWMAFSRSLGASGGYGGDDYHDFDKWDVYVVSLEGTLPATPVKVAHGYFPSWGSDSYGATKTLYLSRREDERAIYKATISSTGTVSNVVKHFSVPTTEGDLHMQASPDGMKVAHREGGSVHITHISGPKAGQKFNVEGGCHPSWFADSKWMIHASSSSNSVVSREDGQYLKYDLDGSGEYHYGSSQDLKWFITRTDGSWDVQNCGRNCHVMPLTVTDNSINTDANSKVLVTNTGSWVDVHAGDVVPPDVKIEAFWAEPASVVPGASTTLKWTVTNATSIKIDGQAVTGTTKSVTPAQTTTYRLTAEGTGGPLTEEVTVEVKPPVLTSITVTPETGTVNTGLQLQLTAAPKDQVGGAIAAGIAWQLTGFGTLSAATGLTTTYTAPTDQAGTVTITASSGTVTKSVTVRVVDPNAIKLQVNCGGPEISGWVSDAAYVVADKTGDPHDFGQTSTTTGVTNPAPADVYRTCRHWDHTYQFTGVPDGSYTVRIHFTDFAGSGRLMNYAIEGVQVLSNFNPADDAGGTGKVVVKDFPNVTVSGNDGMTVAATAGSGNDVFECAIEIIGNGTTLAPGTIIVSAPAAGAALQTGDQLRVDWRASADVSSVRIGLILDPDGDLLSLTTASIDVGTAQWGSFTIAIPASIAGTVVQGTQVRAVVVNYANDQINGMSAPFTIAANDPTAGVNGMHGRQVHQLTMTSLDGIAHTFEVSVAGWYDGVVFSPDGRSVYRFSGVVPTVHRAALTPGAHIVRLRYAGGEIVRRVTVGGR